MERQKWIVARTSDADSLNTNYLWWLKETVNVADAVPDLVVLEALDRAPDQGVDVGPLAADEALRPLRLEFLLYLAEH